MAETAELISWLRAERFAALFVDFDPARGIPAGRNWERELYSQLRQADGVLYVASPTANESRWCFSELSLARSIGKPIFPVAVVAGTERLALLRDVQWVDLAAEGEQAYPRLLAGLRRAGLDPDDAFDWDPTRCPYPGLEPFSTEDAAVFFGRDVEIGRLLEFLQPALQHAAGRFVGIVGPSGSGKSSLLRAGLLPRLQRLPERWVVLAAFRPGQHPIRNLARSLADAFAARCQSLSSAELAERLERGPGELAELASELAETGPGELKVLVVIDQAEELVTRTGANEQQRFLALVKGALSDTSPLWAVATLRSEFLATAPEQAGLAEVIDDSLLVEPLSRNRLAEVIQRPAQRAGLEFAPGLVERMVEETTGGDALPLLAYTLRELYQRVGPQRTISIADYVAVGGVVGVLQRRADRLLDELSRRGQDQLVLPILLKLATIEGESEPTGRRLWRGALGPDEQTVVQAFVDARLLTTNSEDHEATVEVAHEALLRQWSPLRQAIEDSHASLRLRSELEREAADWDQGHRDEAYLVRGGRLAAFEEWAACHVNELTTREREFLEASTALASQELEAAQQSHWWRRQLAYRTGKAGEPAEALRLLRGLLPDDERVFGPNHSDTLATRRSLADWTGEAGEPAEALRLLQELLPDVVRVLGRDHPETLATRRSLTALSLDPGIDEGPRPAFLTEAADLEIGLHRRDGRNWSVELRFSSPRTDKVRVSEPASATFDFASLEELTYDKDEYGRVLGDNLFKAKGIGSGFKEARDEAARSELPLRTRLFVGPSALELHRLLWETIRDPEADVPLLMNENVLFSRYLTSVDWRPVDVRPKVDLRAVVLVANPSDVEEYRTGDRPLPPIDVDAELEQARVGLRDLGLSPAATTELVGDSCSLVALSDALGRGCDILYVVCHGFVAAGKPQLLLEDGSGRVERVPAEEFVSRLRELQRSPRLVVVASYRCAGSEEQRAGDEESNLAALGPQLAEAGVPAVVTMQGDVSRATIATFIPSFFHELKRGGQIDAAMAVARGAVRDRPDWWAPTLFMRLKRGRLWYGSGFGQSFERWPTLLNSIANGRCTPILGPGVIDSLVGPRQEIARRWASAFHLPDGSSGGHDLFPKVAQYLAVMLDSSVPHNEFQKYLGTELLTRHRQSLPDSLYGSGRSIPEEIRGQALDEIFAAVAEVRRREPELFEPHSMLAELPLPLFVTTQPIDLMEEALRAVGKQPEREVCRWKEDDDDVPWPASVFERDPGYQPDKQRPLVFHAFGHVRYPGSVVLTEDDYLDFLIGVTGNLDLVPPFVRKRLSATGLLFLGFQADEWDFRVVFRTLVNQVGRSHRARLTHTVIPTEPESEPVRKYVNDYLRPDNITLYGKGVESFIRELYEIWKGAFEETAL